MDEQTATCYELRVFVTVANEADGKPRHSVEDIVEGVRAECQSWSNDGCDVEIVATTTVDESA